MKRRSIWLSIAGIAVAIGSLVTAYISYPTQSNLSVESPLQAWTDVRPPSADAPYGRDFLPLSRSFQAQTYRSFCGPSSITTVLRAYGVARAEQTKIFPSVASKLKAFYGGMSLAELSSLANHVGLKSEAVYADTLSLDAFRERLKAVLDREGDFVLVNYDRRVLKQSGAGHISPIGAYDADHDLFLVLDEAAYKYPFTWVPASLLYEATRTRADDHYRGVLFIHGYVSPD